MTESAKRGPTTPCGGKPRQVIRSLQLRGGAKRSGRCGVMLDYHVASTYLEGGKAETPSAAEPLVASPHEPQAGWPRSARRLPQGLRRLRLRPRNRRSRARRGRKSRKSRPSPPLLLLVGPKQGLRPRRGEEGSDPLRRRRYRQRSLRVRPVRLRGEAAAPPATDRSDLDTADSRGPRTAPRRPSPAMDLPTAGVLLPNRKTRTPKTKCSSSRTTRCAALRSGDAAGAVRLTPCVACGTVWRQSSRGGAAKGRLARPPRAL